jgi:outer membrane protein TolC
MTPISIRAHTWRTAILLIAAAVGIVLSGCTVGPRYARPSAPVAPAFNEPLPENFKSVDGWKPAQPSDARMKGDWWTLFDDPQLNALEAEIDPANQTLQQAEANFQAARAAIRFNRASEAPTIGTEPSVGAVRDSDNQPYLNISGSNTGEGNFVLPFDLNYEIDLWGASGAQLHSRGKRRRPRPRTSPLRDFRCTPNWRSTTSICARLMPRAGYSTTRS